jgi:hypothetical protein
VSRFAIAPSGWERSAKDPEQVRAHDRVEQRTDLDPDAARLESRQPIPLERAFSASAQDELKRWLLTVAGQQLEHHVGVGVDDHKRQSDGLIEGLAGRLRIVGHRLQAAHEQLERELEALLRVGGGEVVGQRDEVRELVRGQ